MSFVNYNCKKYTIINIAKFKALAHLLQDSNYQILTLL